MNFDWPYLIPTLFGFTAVNSNRMLSDSDAEVSVAAVVVAVSAEDREKRFGAVIPMYCTPTRWRSNWGFLGLTARTTTRTIARTRRAMKEKRRQRQQQQPRKEADEEEEDAVS